jgi:ferredoxin-NADP reductase
MLAEHDYHPLAVAAVVEETDDTRSFVLDVPDALAGTFAYTAGQFCTFRAAIGGNEIVRCYSMSSAPEAGEPLTITVRRVAEGVMSNWMIDTLEPGATIDVMRPTGLFVLRDVDTPIVAFAGGSGITPVMSIIKRALAVTNRSIMLAYANRDAEHVIFADALDRLAAGAAGRLRVHQHLDSERGLLDATACAALVDDSDADCYVCGPGPFMDAVEAGLAMRGVPPDQVFVERFFVPASDVRVGDTPPRSLVVYLGGQRHELSYHAGDTILETTRRGGLQAPFSCEAGNCATCMARLDEGAARMRVNNALTAEEVAAGWVLTCQALPAGEPLVVNYDA